MGGARDEEEGERRKNSYSLALCVPLGEKQPWAYSPKVGWTYRSVCEIGCYYVALSLLQ